MEAAPVAVTIAVSAAKTVLERLLHMVEKEVGKERALLRGVERNVRFIRDELEMMRSFLSSSPAAACPYAAAGGWRDGCGNCSSDAVRNTWVRQLRDLAYDIEDCLLDSGLVLEGRNLVARHRLAKRILDLKARILDLQGRNQMYGVFLDGAHRPTPTEQQHLQPDDDDETRPLLSSEHSPHADDKDDDRWEVVIGRDDEKKALIKRVKKKRASNKVVSVWGMDGVGKSSLARMIYNDAKFIRRFDCRAWVTVPHHHAPPIDYIGYFERRLREQLGVDDGLDVSAWLREKKCLVVVDDVSSPEEWQHIWQCLAAIGEDGRIVVTTRQKDLVRRCGGEYELKPLARKESLELLFHKVYKNDTKGQANRILRRLGLPLGRYKLPSGTKEQANHILKRCRGLPLAIVTTGGALISSKTNKEWMNLVNHLGPELNTDSDIIRVISLGYDGLPYHLKSCFLYMSIFPENHEIRLTRLLRRWITEGYIAKHHDMAVEKVGRMYYNELINRCMIQPSKKARSSMEVEHCRVHGLILHKVILSISIQENQLFIMDNHCRDPQGNIRHLVVTRWKRHEHNIGKVDLTLVRSLTVFGECPLSLITPKLRLLRVLDLEDTIGLENADLKDIGELRHLRYLGLRGTNISKLPSLKKLKCLEILDVQNTKLTQLPDRIASLEKLCGLTVGVNFVQELVDKMAENNNAEKCSGKFLETLTDNRVPSLQVLGVVYIADGKVARKIGHLTSLRKLGVDLATSKGIGVELCHSIERLVQLERLEVRSESLEFLKGIDRPPPKLVSLRLCGHLGNLPGWTGPLNDLTKVKLLWTRLKQHDIDMLGKLPNLKLLGLWEDSFVGESMCFTARSKFQKLKLLYIEGLKNIATITIGDGTLPVLEKLWVKKCLTLSDSKEGLRGVQFLLSLKEIVVTSCGDKPHLVEALRRKISKFAIRPKFITGKSIATWKERMRIRFSRLITWK